MQNDMASPVIPDYTAHALGGIYIVCEEIQGKLDECLVYKPLSKTVHIFKPWLLFNQPEMTVT